MQMIALGMHYISGIYAGRANISLENVIEYRKSLVFEVEDILNLVSNWGRLNLVSFNPSKTQVCTLIAKRRPFKVAITFQGISLKLL